jgi:multicomponent K+:H+ antiporter subunit E
MTVRAAVASTLLMALLWLLLANELSVAQGLLGLVLGACVTAATAGVRMPRPRVRRPLLAVQLLALFALDIVVANLAVARAALSPRLRLAPRFVHVPLDLAEPAPVTLLAAMVTLTPGTVSVDINLEARVLLVHALIVEDAAATAAEIKSRYESRIKEIFQC